jgi:hypothetical protein
MVNDFNLTVSILKEYSFQNLTLTNQQSRFLMLVIMLFRHYHRHQCIFKQFLRWTHGRTVASSYGQNKFNLLEDLVCDY